MALRRYGHRQKEDVMFRRGTAGVPLLGLVFTGVMSSLAASAKESEATAVVGIAKGADQRPLVDYLVRLRSLDTGRVVATARTSATGEYAFRAVNAGRYGVEIMDVTDRIVATAGPF